MEIILTEEALWNLCFHSYLRGTGHGRKANMKEFNKFYYSKENNGLLEHMDYLEKIQTFKESQQDIPPEIGKIINERFWDMI